MSQKYAHHFKQEAINLALNSEQTYRQVADDLSINYNTFCNWLYKMKKTYTASDKNE